MLACYVVYFLSIENNIDSFWLGHAFSDKDNQNQYSDHLYIITMKVKSVKWNI